MIHKGYVASPLHGQPVYRCCTCQYDSFYEENTRAHLRNADHPKIILPDPRSPLGSYPQFKGLRVAISILTWNTGDFAEESIAAVDRELLVLNALGVETLGIWFDNGSDYTTLHPVVENWRFARNQTNEGQSNARNKIAKIVAEFDADYWIMVDGDIKMIPNSGIGLLESIMESQGSVACVGFTSYLCSGDPNSPDISEDAREIPILHHTPVIAWTQYGIFEAWMFGEGGLAFDESGPFAGPGWGLEDDDLYLQMLNMGFTAANTNLFTYLHWKRSKCIQDIGPQKATDIWMARKKYLMEKWSSASNSKVQHQLNSISNQTIRVID